MEGKKILTVEGLTDGDKLHPIQRAFSEHGGYQCGYCTSGQMMAAKALLDKNPKPTREEVRRALAGNLCRCGAYPKIIESVLGAAGKT
jgi:aerobic-type carbon monoxide dehydrogenase small subunit (CoxS/CutS family)